MKYLKISFVLFAFLITSSFTNDNNKGKVTITIKNPRNLKGNFGIYFFKNQETFTAEKPYMSKYVKKKSLKDNTYTFEVDAGTIGISAIDDENANKEMDYNWIGIPTEGFGFSDYYHTGWSRPTFSNFDFKVEKGKTKNVSITFRYM